MTTLTTGLPYTLPRPLRALLAWMAVVQAALLAAIWAAVQAGARPFGLPPGLALGGASAALLALTLPPLAAEQIDPRLAAVPYRALSRFRRRPASLLIVLPLLAIAVRYLPGRWLGYPLLAAQAMLLALLVYLAGRPLAVGRVGQAAAALLVVLAGVGLRLWLVNHAAFDDEGMTLNAAVNVATGGRLAPAMMRLPAAAPARPDWGRALWLYGLWVRVFGAGVVQMRLLGWLLGVAALGTLGAAVRTWYGTRAALAAVALAAVSPLGLLSAAGRNNALPMLAAALTLTLYARTTTRPGAWWRHAWVGLAAALSLEAHLLLLALAFALGVDYLRDAIRARREGWRAATPLGAYLGGLLAGAALYAALRLATLPDPAGYVEYLRTFGLEPGIGPALAARLGAALTRYRLWWAASPAGVGLVGLSAAAAWWRGAEADRRWLALLLAGEVGYFLFNPVNVVSNHYTSFALPLLYVGTGPLIVRGFRRSAGQMSRRWQQAASVLAVIVLAAFSLALARAEGQNAARAESLRRPLAEQAAAHAGPGGAIMTVETTAPYLPAADLLLTPGGHFDSTLAPALAGVPHDAYWLEQMLVSPPLAAIDSDYLPAPVAPDSTTLAGSYLAAVGAAHPADYLWLVPRGWLFELGNGAPLQMAGHRVEGGTLHTLWVTRAPLDADPVVTLTLVGPEGTEYTISAPLVDSLDGAAPSAWMPYRFHRVRLPLPEGAPPGAYSATLSLDAPAAVCAPGCAVALALTLPAR